MKKMFALLLLLCAAQGFSQDTIPTSRVRDFIGKEVWVKGRIAAVKEASTENRVVYINVDKAFPDNVFTVVMNVKYAQRMKVNLATAKGKMIFVKGTIAIDKAGGPVPQIFNPTQIQIK
ncbi:hypothetical protein HYN48_02730 [Flavobacterium magnum]|uniref:DNA-binding protein n=1 Tax=Flavobacterium magnum TaxID=2162713 RepID=A0A2S0RBQ5_9FLAO|nr:hypothetical protein [Flavobacterium magnum]AWA29086.1 hypothetical protein HYN48_02730 [Flavobacterium magnum]